MKKITLSFLIILTISSSVSLMCQETITLPKPDTKSGKKIMEAFQLRQSLREFKSDKLTQQQLSDLLWAANGINRPSEKKRTAATASNSQEIDVYLIAPEATYFYDAINNKLEPRYKGDLRKVAAAGQDFSATAPVTLLIVGDLDRLRGNDEVRKMNLACMDAGIVSANIYLFCSGNGFATVARATMDEAELIKALHLTKNQKPILNHPVGLIKK